MNDPIGTIQERHDQESAGALAVNVYRGALRECDSRKEAFWATVAFIVATFRANQETE